MVSKCLFLFFAPIFFILSLIGLSFLGLETEVASPSPIETYEVESDIATAIPDYDATVDAFVATEDAISSGEIVTPNPLQLTATYIIQQATANAGN